ncbi:MULTISPECIES: hypothetical protein [Bacillaceae]|uniref:hypothetical protein n=1 Tax=Bacillaceae TaxID=186817 RepID=UPI00101C3F09|nr:hypothetical protein [Ectobacillus funiculus]
MGLWDRWFGSRMSNTVIVHTLHLCHGYKQRIWEIGKDVDANAISSKADNNELYVLYSYIDGEEVEHITTKELFKAALDQYEEIEQGVEESIQQAFH